MKKTLLTLLTLAPFLTFAQATNDECATATLITVSPATNCTAPFAGTLTGATATAATLLCEFNTANHDVWYSFTAIDTRVAVNVTSTIANDFSYYTYDVYEATCSAAPLVCGGSNMGNVLTNLNIGQTYYLRVYNAYDPAATTGSFTICAVTPAPAITTSATAFTVEELVTNTFATGTNLQITNVASSSGADFANAASLGSFDKNGSSFPLQNGIILSTGNIADAPGPNVLTQGAGDFTNWQGDADLEIAIPPNNTANYYNATSLAFDFIPTTSDIGFNYVFASEEYGEFECNYSDAFAILLQDITDNTPVQNLAVIPGTTIPVSVTTVHNVPANMQCAASNPQYFAQAYSSTDYTAPINFNGVTVQMEASATVIPGHSYHIKFVIADRGDTAFDSALFVGASVDQNYIPFAPTGEAVQTFTEGETLASLDVEGENIQWYATETSETALPLTTPLIDNTTYYATQTVNNTESARFGVTAMQVLGLSLNALPNLSYYPNPVKNNFTLANTTAIDAVSIYNTLGQQVIFKAVSGTNTTIDFSALNSGIYFVKVQVGTTQKTIKVVKQ